MDWKDDEQPKSITLDNKSEKTDLSKLTFSAKKYARGLSMLPAEIFPCTILFAFDFKRLLIYSTVFDAEGSRVSFFPD